MDSWDDLRLFLQCFRSVSLSEAARALGVNQSTVSRRLAGLEATLGGALFHRSARQFQPTPLAEQLMPYAETLEQSAALFYQRARESDRPRGRVRIATTHELSRHLLAPAMGLLRQQYPDIQVEMVSGSELANLDRRVVDIALRTTETPDPTYASACLGHLTYGVYATPNYLRSLGAKKLPPWSDLDWLLLDERFDHLEENRWVNHHRGRRPAVFRADTTSVLAVAAEQGLGAALLPDALVRFHHALVRVPGTPVPDFTRALWWVALNEVAALARIQAVLAWLEACTQEALS